MESVVSVKSFEVLDFISQLCIFSYLYIPFMIVLSYTFYEYLNMSDAYICVIQTWVLNNLPADCVRYYIQEYSSKDIVLLDMTR